MFQFAVNKRNREIEIMKWNYILKEEELDSIDLISKENLVFIFKHSTTCGISRMALNRIESKWKLEDAEQVRPYFIDLLSFRGVSNAIAKRYDVVHESPQVLVIRNGKCIYDASHSSIRLSEILEQNPK